MENSKSQHLLYAEDDLGDVELARMSIADIGWKEAELCVLEDGDATLSFLNDCESGKNTLPDMVLLDLNLPRVKGLEILKHIKSSSRCKEVPVAILSTSNSPNDIEEAKKLGAVDYFTKPGNFELYKQIFRKIRTHLEQK